jgi:hypothetical protein
VEDQPVPDVAASIAPTDVLLWVALDVHKFSIVAATLSPVGGTPGLARIETTEKAIRRFIDRSASSGDSQHRGHITKAGNRHARRPS